MKLHIPPGEFTGYLFDCDGTLIDSMPLHYRAWCQSFLEKGDSFPFTEAQFYSLGGTPTFKIAEKAIEKSCSALNPQEIVERKERYYLELLPSVAVIEPVIEWVKQGRKRNIPMMVVSGSSRRVVLKSLEQLGISDWFFGVVTPEQITRGKPDPEMFLLAAQKMGLLPKDCLVFEDSETGFQAAKAAGMCYVAVPQPHQR